MKTLADLVNDAWHGEKIVAVRYRTDADASKTGVCTECGQFNGKIYFLRRDGSHDGPKLPIHPNCRCRYVGLTAEKLEKIRADS